LGLIGAALLITGGRWTFTGEHWQGYAFAAGSAFIWATYSLLTRRVQTFPTAAVGLFCLVSGTLALLCHATFEAPFIPSPAQGLLIGLLAIGPMGAAFFLWDAALKRGDPRTIGASALERATAPCVETLSTKTRCRLPILPRKRAREISSWTCMKRARRSSRTASGNAPASALAAAPSTGE